MVNACSFEKKEDRMTACTLLNCIFYVFEFLFVPVLDSLANFFH